jgi:hypothetical protein
MVTVYTCTSVRRREVEDDGRMNMMELYMNV